LIIKGGKKWACYCWTYYTNNKKKYETYPNGNHELRKWSRVLLLSPLTIRLTTTIETVLENNIEKIQYS